jgi:hypothetical protein
MAAFVDQKTLLTFLGWAIAAILTIWKSIIYEMNFPMIFHHLVRK